MAQQHGPNCYCGACKAKRYIDNAEEATYGETQRETRDRISGRRSGPPLAKDPANQAYLNRIWRKSRPRRNGSVLRSVARHPTVAAAKAEDTDVPATR
jgi:hypothetical protein